MGCEESVWQKAAYFLTAHIDFDIVVNGFAGTILLQWSADS